MYFERTNLRNFQLTLFRSAVVQSASNLGASRLGERVLRESFLRVVVFYPCLNPRIPLLTPILWNLVGLGQLRVGVEVGFVDRLGWLWALPVRVQSE